MSSTRAQTRERLLYDEKTCCPSSFPTPIVPLSVFEDMMYKVAYVSGYIGTKTDFKEDLANALNGANSLAGLIIQKGSVNDFPDIGLENAIYIDTKNSHIYYWKEDVYYLVNGSSSGLEEGTILHGGDASTI